MAIGSAIVLFVIGAILAFALEVDVNGINLQTIGVILMVAGLVGGVIGLAMSMSRRRRSTTQEIMRSPTGDQVIHTEDRL